MSDEISKLFSVFLNHIATWTVSVEQVLWMTSPSTVAQHWSVTAHSISSLISLTSQLSKTQSLEVHIISTSSSSSSSLEMEPNLSGRQKSASENKSTNQPLNIIIIKYWSETLNTAVCNGVRAASKDPFAQDCLNYKCGWVTPCTVKWAWLPVTLVTYQQKHHFLKAPPPSAPLPSALSPAP